MNTPVFLTSNVMYSTGLIKCSVMLCSDVLLYNFTQLLNHKEYSEHRTVHAFFLIFYVRHFIYFQYFSVFWRLPSHILINCYNNLWLLLLFTIFYDTPLLSGLRELVKGSEVISLEKECGSPLPPDPAAFQTWGTIGNILPAPSASYQSEWEVKQVSVSSVLKFITESAEIWLYYFKILS